MTTISGSSIITGWPSVWVKLKITCPDCPGATRFQAYSGGSIVNSPPALVFPGIGAKKVDGLEYVFDTKLQFKKITGFGWTCGAVVEFTLKIPVGNDLVESEKYTFDPAEFAPTAPSVNPQKVEKLAGHLNPGAKLLESRGKAPVAEPVSVPKNPLGGCVYPAGSDDDPVAL